MRGLLGSTVHGRCADGPLDTIPGASPELQARATACSFAPRCDRTVEGCLHGVPELIAVPPGDACAACTPDDASPPSVEAVRCVTPTCRHRHPKADRDACC